MDMDRTEALVPLALLIAERKKRQAAEKRVKELEAALRNTREEWVFRRKRMTVPK
jgi:hypothetical protein